MNIGREFHEKTKYFRDNLGGEHVKWSKKPELYKSYKNSEIINLPSFKNMENRKDFTDLLFERKSIRKYKQKKISLKQLSYLLWCSNGIQRIEYNFPFRTAPSAGALYPVETYIVSNYVENLAEGIYHYKILEHELELIKEGSFKKNITIACLSQYMLMNASVIFLWSAVFERSEWKYKDRAFRYIYMEAGHIAQNLALGAVSINLGTCQIGAFFDEELNEILELDDKKESIIYLSAIGFPA